MVDHPACQCARWPEKCWASHVGTRGLCAICMPGNCERPRPVTSEYADVTHKAPGTGAQLAPGPMPGRPAKALPAPQS